MSARFTDVKFTTFTAKNAVNDVGGGACKIVPNNYVYPYVYSIYIPYISHINSPLDLFIL